MSINIVTKDTTVINKNGNVQYNLAMLGLSTSSFGKDQKLIAYFKRNRLLIGHIPTKMIAARIA